jgi:glycosyltransferase involved in cell wall biosynthesis
MWYQAADAFVMPTEELEGFGIVTIEAFASGLPVIATPAGANPEVAGKYCAELIAKTQKLPRDLADSILIYLENKERFNSVDYSERAKKDFHWPTIISEINKVIMPV